MNLDKIQEMQQKSIRKQNFWKYTKDHQPFIDENEEDDDYDDSMCHRGTTEQSHSSTGEVLLNKYSSTGAVHKGSTGAVHKHIKNKKKKAPAKTRASSSSFCLKKPRERKQDSELANYRQEDIRYRCAARQFTEDLWEVALQQGALSPSAKMRKWEIAFLKLFKRYSLKTFLNVYTIYTDSYYDDFVNETGYDLKYRPSALSGPTFLDKFEKIVKFAKNLDPHWQQHPHHYSINPTTEEEFFEYFEDLYSAPDNDYRETMEQLRKEDNQ